MKTVFVKPKKGLVVRDPDNLEILPESGANVMLSTYWRRRLAAGDVETASKTKKKGGDDQ